MSHELSQESDLELIAENTRLEYTKPNLEQHQSWIMTVGVSVPIGP